MERDDVRVCMRLDASVYIYNRRFYALMHHYLSIVGVTLRKESNPTAACRLSPSSSWLLTGCIATAHINGS